MNQCALSPRPRTLTKENKDEGTEVENGKECYEMPFSHDVAVAHINLPVCLYGTCSR